MRRIVEINKTLGGRGGFTVLEMLVVLGVTMFLSTIFVGYGANLKDQIAVFREEARLTQVLFKAKTYSIQARKTGEGAAACGYGVSLDRNSRTYQIYLKAKIDEKKCEDTYSQPSSWAYDANRDETIGVSFGVDGKISLPGSGQTAVAFEPPRPEVHVTGENNDGEAEFTLCAAAIPDFCRKVVVTPAGQITTRRE